MVSSDIPPGVILETSMPSTMDSVSKCQFPWCLLQKNVKTECCYYLKMQKSPVCTYNVCIYTHVINIIPQPHGPHGAHGLRPVVQPHFVQQLVDGVAGDLCQWCLLVAHQAWPQVMTRISCDVEIWKYHLIHIYIYRRYIQISRYLSIYLSISIIYPYLYIYIYVYTYRYNCTKTLFYISKYIYIYRENIFLYIFIPIYVYSYVMLLLSLSIYTSMSPNVYRSADLWIYISVFVNVCIYKYIYIYIV